MVVMKKSNMVSDSAKMQPRGGDEESREWCLIVPKCSCMVELKKVRYGVCRMHACMVAIEVKQGRHGAW